MLTDKVRVNSETDCIGFVFEPKYTKLIGNAPLIEAILLVGGVLDEVGTQVLFDDTKELRIAERV